jgi:hypothetical protein
MVVRAAPDCRHSRRGSEPGGFRSRRCQPGNHSLEDPTDATPPGRTLGAAAQPGNPVSASGAAVRARAVVEGAIHVSPPTSAAAGESVRHAHQSC